MTGSACVTLLDDHRMDVELTLDALRVVRLPHRIGVAANGQPALDHVSGIGAYPDRRRVPLPDRIWLDGFEVLCCLKDDRQRRRGSVVGLTSSSEDGDPAKLYDIGAKSHLVEHAAFHGFVDVINQLDHTWLKLNVRPSAAL